MASGRVPIRQRIVFMVAGNCISTRLVSRLRQFPDLHIPESNGRTFAFKAKVAIGWACTRTARNFLAIDPQPDLAIDGPHIVVVPLT